MHFIRAKLKFLFDFSFYVIHGLLFDITDHKKQAESDFCTEPWNISCWKWIVRKWVIWQCLRWLASIVKNCMFDNNWVGWLGMETHVGDWICLAWLVGLFSAQKRTNWNARNCHGHEKKCSCLLSNEESANLNFCLTECR